MIKYHIKFSKQKKQLYNPINKQEISMAAKELFQGVNSYIKAVTIISKYKITHIVSKNKIENIPNEIILEIHHTTFFNESYYLYLLTREGGEHVFPVKKS